MRASIGRGLLAAALLTGAGLGARGYTGTYHVTVTNTGSEPAGAGVRIVEPVAGSFRKVRPSGMCWYGRLVEGRQALNCDLPGGSLDPGEVRKFRVDAEALT